MHEDAIKAVRDQTVWRRTGVSRAAMHRGPRVCLREAAVMARRLIPSAHPAFVCLLGFVTAAPLSKQIRVNGRVNTHTHRRPWVDSQALPHAHISESATLNFHKLPDLRILLLVLQEQLITRTRTTFHPDKHS